MANKKLTIEQARQNFQKAYDHKRLLNQRQEEDFEVALGKQWTDEAKTKLESKGIKPLTVNVIRPMINLITGLERQNRTDFRAFPEGSEDSLDAEIATRLLKNLMKQSEGEFKFSETFEDGLICGESALEPWIDNTFNLINGKPMFKKKNYNEVFPAPNSVEYDYSDAPYVCVFTKGLTKDELISLFPEKEKKIENLETGKIDLDTSPDTHIQDRDYPKKTQSGIEDDESDGFDLVEHYYKKMVKKSYIANMVTGNLEEFESEEEADEALNQAIQQDPQASQKFRLIQRVVPEIWVYSFTGGLNESLVDERAWFYPKWKNYHFLNYFSLFSTIKMSKTDSHYKIQGVVHGAKDSQFEVNKRKTQELHHLNSSTNSGWLTEQGAWVDPKKVKDFGASPGVNLEYKRGRPKPERLFPMALSQGHAQLVLEAKQDVKDETGINSDLLAMQEDGQASGRAIALRQRQGLVMVQRYFDNLSRTKKMAGKFWLSQLSEVYSLDSALKVLGEAFLEQHFQDIDPIQGQPTGQINYLAAQQRIQQIFNDTEFGKYDVSIGEAVASETMKMANFNELTQLAELLASQGQAIPPDILVEASQVQETVKNRLITALKQQAEAQAQAREEQKQLEILKITGGDPPQNKNGRTQDATTETI